jgi:glycosyltransferase involved in cell wall biosynthesis
MTSSAAARDGSEPIRVLELTGVSVGGSAEHLLLLSKYLDPARFAVHIALWSGGPLDDEIVRIGVPVQFLDDRNEMTTTSAKAFSGGRLRFFTGFVHLVRLLRRERFHIIHTHTSVAGMLGRLAAVIARVPVRVHMLHSIASNDHVGRSSARLFRIIERLADHATTHYIAGSDAIARKFAESGLADASKITRIHYSLDLERRALEAASGTEAMRELLGATPDDILVALVGRLEEQKGVEYLLDAAVSVVERSPQVKIAIVGEGSLRPALEERARRLSVEEHVTFTGWLSSIGTVMAATDVMAIPSRWEAFGIVNLEAMAAETPIVGFAVEGIPEVVDDEVTGLLVPSGDVAALADALVRLADDPLLRKQFGSAGRRRLEAQFLPEKMVSKHAELFEKLVGVAEK